MSNNNNHHHHYYRHHDIASRSSSFADSMDRISLSDSREHDNPHHHDDAVNPSFPQVTLSRTVSIPDPLKVARCLRLPEYGPKIMFFSGGSALRGLSEVLKVYTHNSIHLITPFDSGGSSAEIRKAFGMLSVGDLRNRLMALSDDSSLGNPDVKALFSHRLSKHEPLLAQSEFRDILSGRHVLCKAVSLPMRSILTSHLRWFANRMPPTFDLCGASIGNLIITGCFLEHDQDIVTAIYLIWKLLGVKGKVRPLTAANLQLRAHYANGTVEVGQHLLGKHARHQNIVKIDLVDSLPPQRRDCDADTTPTSSSCSSSSSPLQPSRTCHIDIVSSELVNSADVLCYPMGSFFGSLLVNLLPIGVGRAIVKRHCPKIYIPNTGVDPEMYGYTMVDCIQRIIDMVRTDVATAAATVATSRSNGKKNDATTNGIPETTHNDNAAVVAADVVPISRILNFVLVDTKYCHYCVDIDKEEIAKRFHGEVVLLDLCLVDDDTKATIDTLLDEKCRELNPTKVVEVLLTLG